MEKTIRKGIGMVSGEERTAATTLVHATVEALCVEVRIRILVCYFTFGYSPRRYHAEVVTHVDTFKLTLFGLLV